MTLATMANNILRFTPGLNPDLVKSIIQTSYIQLATRDWNKLKLTRVFTTVAPYSTGVVSVAANGTVTGVGTTFTAAMVGRQMRVEYTDAFFEVATYASPTEITLTDWTGATVAVGHTFSIFQTIYSVNTLFGLVFDVIYQVPLQKKSQSYFNKLDPPRSSTGSSPVYWAYAGTTSAGVIQIELYPVPTVVIPLRIEGKRRTSTLGDSESPYLPEALVEAHAQIDCYRMKEIQDPKGGWEVRRDAHQKIFQGLYESFEDEDYQIDAHHDKVKDTMGGVGYPSDDNFQLSHDVD
jgi:hypothetical protein